MVTICTTRFHIKKLHILPTQLDFCVDLRTVLPTEYQFIGSYNRDGERLLGHQMIY